MYINVFVYSNLNGEGPSLFERVYTLSKILYWVIRTNIIYFIFIIPGMIWAIMGKNKKWLERFFPLALSFFLFLGIYVGGSELPYYALPLAVFTVLGFAPAGRVLERIGEKVIGGGRVLCKSVKEGRAFGFFCTGTVLLGLCIVWTNSMNIPHRLDRKEDIFLYRFREIIAQTPEPTLLNINCLDAGLYTVCDIVPTCRWFQTQTLAIDDVLTEQERYIREGQTDYVLARDYYPEVIWDKYELVCQAPWQQEGNEFTFYLFRRVDR